MAQYGWRGPPSGYQEDHLDQPRARRQPDRSAQPLARAVSARRRGRPDRERAQREGVRAASSRSPRRSSTESTPQARARMTRLAPATPLPDRSLPGIRAAPTRRSTRSTRRAGDGRRRCTGPSRMGRGSSAGVVRAPRRTPRAGRRELPERDAVVLRDLPHPAVRGTAPGRAGPALRRTAAGRRGTLARWRSTPASTSATSTSRSPTSTGRSRSTTACSASSSQQRYGDQAAFVSAGGYHHHIGLNTWESRGRLAAAAQHAPASTTSPSATRTAGRSRDALRRLLERRHPARRRERPRRQRGDLPARSRRQRRRAVPGPAPRGVAALGRRRAAAWSPSRST